METPKAGVQICGFVLQKHTEPLVDLLLVYLLKFTLRFQTRALELYGKHNKAIIQCFIMVLILKALLEKEKSECS